jgi:hypothetical protein
MFAMLHGRWPVHAARTDAGDVEALVADVVRAQVDAGLELVTDGQVRFARPSQALLDALARGDIGADGLLVRSWASTAAVPEAAAVAVAATITGPWTLAQVAGEASGAGSAREPGDPVRLAGLLAGELESLGAAGCPLVIVDEPAAVGIGTDADARRQFREAQLTLLEGAQGIHAMLAITGGSVWDAGAETILEAPWSSHLFDLVAGPDNWYLVRATPGERGIVCAALKAPSPEDQAPLLVWAARYAASSNGRGLDRVGLTNAASLADLEPAGAARALSDLARAARLAAMDPDEAIAAGLDERTFRQPAGRGAKRGGLPRA